MAKILIADDSHVVRKSYESMLSFMGHDVVSCNDGKEAVAAFLADRVDLVILDVDMPVMDGLDACREIRRHPEGVSIPIIIVSALDEENDIIEGLNAGADDYMVKPVKEAHLMAKLKTSLGISALHKSDFDLVKNKTVFVGKYRIERVLGYGAHSAVFLATDIINGNRQVALKLLKENFASEDVAGPLLDGARRMMEVDSPYIIKVFDIGQFKDRVYVVMEYAPGGCLLNQLKSRNLSELEGVALGYDAMLGLKALEEYGIVHLDIKPGNILCGDNNYKLADFGVVVPRNSATMPLNAEIWSTAAYISPEYLTLEEDLSAKSDIYSLGISIYQAVTGDNPFDSDRPSVGMFRQVNLVPSPLTDYNPSISKYFSDTLRAMLEKSPKNRPSVQELVDVFGNLLDYLKSRDAQLALAGISTKGLPKNKASKTEAGVIHDEGVIPLHMDDVLHGRDLKKVEKDLNKAKKNLDSFAMFKRLGNKHAGSLMNLIFSLDRKTFWKIIIVGILIGLVSAVIGMTAYRLFADGKAPVAVSEGPMHVVICKKCKLIEQKRLFDINQAKCPKCGGDEGDCMKCSDCKMIFAAPEIKEDPNMPPEEYEKIREEKYRCPKCKSQNIFPMPPSVKKKQ
ncbi:MAG: response regulator [Victivallaceae bacterium]